MRTDTPITVYRKDYQPYPYDIPEVALAFDLAPDATEVRCTMHVQRKPGASADAALILDGEDLELVSVGVNGAALTADSYHLSEQNLAIYGLPADATVEIISRCKPSANSTLMGLYVSGGNFFTQCEAEGFRRITWFADRPDVMSRYRVTLRAQPQYPVLLSNGNLMASRQLPDGRNEVEWEDPFPKPCYLFALVAGNLTHRETTVKTASGRDVLLQVYSDPGSETKTEWALDSLVRALRWDETRFGLELDLDRFMIVAVHDFNMGAMENKGLNIFNAAYVLADADSATDANYEGIESVIGHEYFHNWTGNRVTCRDWFQLSLKEGLTVFRDQEFSADMMAHDMDAAAAASARAVKRIDDVVALRAAQFPEDAGPMAHPIRPESYQEIGNFYTATVYEKGAEVIRMQHTLLGEEGFRAGMDEYFRRHDGQAVTCDDFVDAMESVYVRQHPGRDLSVFRRWYRQAGTPRVAVKLEHDAATRRCTVTLTQECLPVGVERKAGADYVKAPYHIPFAIGLLDQDGRALPLRHDGAVQETALLELTTPSQQWVFEDIGERPVPSLLRDFSAPVIVDYDWTDEELALLSAHDTNPFARWEAGQELATRQILALAEARQAGRTLHADAAFINAWRALLTDPAIDAAYRARALALPSEKTLAERMHAVDPPALAVARDFLRAELGRQLAAEFRLAFEQNQTPGEYSPAPVPAGMRALKNLALSHLLAAGEHDAQRLAEQQYERAGNMTDSMAALSALINYGQGDFPQEALAAFYDKWRDNPLVVDKWFALQAAARSTTVHTARELMTHPAFTLRNPNRARALIFQFCLNNARGMHHPDGSGYAFWAEQVLALDALNPEIAARLGRALDNWSRFVPALRAPMQAALQQVRAHEGLSRNVQEIVSKALEFAA
ncbi:Aminopeptidase N [Achromobacter spanius]|uniref:aminopeptidase N n=1 Tax=Achromobacter spanius TaxID=217203 RepID=UPI000C2C563C|nr:aminopeptidase N [Achromobacter spanius]AUA59272.1 aminopeptidase N [Achromobacter spanius]CAB3676465.1 Aminopeptidase N [Achromobacter spanius]SPT38980.1 Aminopeptidase N [Achromobacter denitrificans]VEE58526.1 Aminopeptidase N [Achromobacter spanius]